MPAPARDGRRLSPSRAVVFDFGDTLLKEGQTDFRAGAAAVLALAREPVRCSAAELATALAELMADLDPRRRSAQMEIPPAAVRRLVYEPLGITFDRSTDDLEWAFGPLRPAGVRNPASWVRSLRSKRQAFRARC